MEGIERLEHADPERDQGALNGPTGLLCLTTECTKHELVRSSYAYPFSRFLTWFPNWVIEYLAAHTYAE